jgi:hypothetical protein
MNMSSSFSIIVGSCIAIIGCFLLKRATAPAHLYSRKYFWNLFFMVEGFIGCIFGTLLAICGVRQIKPSPDSFLPLAPILVLFLLLFVIVVLPLKRKMRHE